MIVDLIAAVDQLHIVIIRLDRIGGSVIGVGHIIDHHRGGGAVLQDRADLIVERAVLLIQIINDILQLIHAGLEGGLLLVLHDLDQSDVDILCHEEALGGLGGDKQGAALHLGLILGEGLRIEDGVLLTIDRSLQIHDICDIVCVQSQRLGGRLNVHDLVIGVVLHLVPVVLIHGVQIGQRIADFLDLDLLAVGNHLAGPGPLIGGLVVRLHLHIAGVGIDQVLGGSCILAHHDGGDDITVLLVQGIHTRGNAGGLAGSDVALSVLAGTVFVPGGDVGILNAGGHGIHAINDDVGPVAASHDLLDGSGQVDSCVIAVDLVVVRSAATGQGDILLVDGLGVSRISILGDIVVIADLAGDFGQRVHAVLVDGISAPRIHQSVVAGLGNIALVGLDLDDVHRAVNEDGAGVQGLVGQVAVSGVNAGDEDVVVGSLHQIHADQVAVLVQIDVVGQILQVDLIVGVLVQDLHVILSGISVVVLGTVNGDAGAQLESGDLTVRDNLGLGKGLNLTVSHSHQVDLILHNVSSQSDILGGDIEGLLVLVLGQGLHVGVAHLVQTIDVEGRFVLLLVIVIGSLGQIGVDDGDVNVLGSSVLEHLGQHAVAGGAHAVLVVLVQILNGEVGIAQDLALGLTVDGDGEIVVLNRGLAQLVVQILAGNLSGVLHNQLVVVHIGADLVALPGPGVGRTAEDVDGAIQLQVGLIPLSKLDSVVVLGVVLGVINRGGGTGNAAGDVGGNRGTSGDHSAVDGDLLALVRILHQGGLQGIHGVQAGLLAGGGTVAHELVVAVGQADLRGTAHDVDGPVGAGVALDGAVIAQSGQQHLQEGKAGQGALGPEGAVGVAVDQAGLHAVGDVAGKGGTHGHVLEGSGLGAQGLSGGLAKHHAGDDLGSSATGEGALRLEITIGITVDDLQCGHDVDGLSIRIAADVIAVAEVLGAGADGDQRHGHHQSKHQRKELLHWDFSSF